MSTNPFEALAAEEREPSDEGEHEHEDENEMEEEHQETGGHDDEEVAGPAAAAASASGGQPKGKKARKKEKQERRRRERVQERAEQQSKGEQEAGVAYEGEFGEMVSFVLVGAGLKHLPEDITPVGPYKWRIGKCFVKPKGGFEMNVEGLIYADQHLAVQIIAELKSSGSFLPALKQVANVACLPGIVGSSLGMPDIHSGYGFAVGCVAAMDTTDPNAVVSPGGVGFDINCGVRLLRSNLKEGDLYHNGDPKRLRKLATALYDAIPTGVGSSGAYIATEADLKNALKSGMRWCLESGYCWLEDLECCEEQGCFKDADPNKVSSRARKRGMPQMGTLGSGNHYIEVQVVDEVFDEAAASAMGLEKGNVCIMIHSGSRGLGHQVCTDALQVMESSGVKVPDRQLSAVRIKSPEGQNYLQAMAAAANYAFVNRTLMAHSARKAVTDVFDGDARELGLYVVYDVAHNIAKVEEHRPAEEGGPTRILLVHRKGATRAFPPGHPEIPEKYRGVGQPVLIGGSMGTCSYVLTGTHKAMEETFGSTCHGAGRALSRSQALRENDSNCVLNRLRSSGIEVRIAQPRLAAEEADVAYKDVESVVATCHEAGISKKTVRLRPLAVIKG